MIYMIQEYHIVTYILLISYVMVHHGIRLIIHIVQFHFTFTCTCSICRNSETYCSVQVICSDSKPSLCCLIITVYYRFVHYVIYHDTTQFTIILLGLHCVQLFNMKIFMLYPFRSSVTQLCYSYKVTAIFMLPHFICHWTILCITSDAV